MSSAGISSTCFSSEQQKNLTALCKKRLKSLKSQVATLQHEPGFVDILNGYMALQRTLLKSTQQTSG